MKKADLTKFDYQKVGKQDADMWRAYYNHQFFKLFWRLLAIIKSQLGLTWFKTIRIAYYAGWAAADYRINRKNVNQKRILKNLVKYCKLISDNSVQPFDYQKAAELELRWWNVHRKSTQNNKALEEAIAAAAAITYNADPKKFMKYGHYRAEAMILPRHHGDSKDNIIEWQKIYELTIKSWQELHKAANS